MLFPFSQGFEFQKFSPDFWVSLEEFGLLFRTNKDASQESLKIGVEVLW